MNILSYIHIHRLPNPSGVGRVIDRMLSSHAERFPEACHRMLVDRTLYDTCYSDLSNYWKMASFIPHRRGTSWQQANWVWRDTPLAEQYWDEVEIVYCPAESYVPTRKAKLVCTIHDVAGFEESLYPNDRSKRLHCFKWRMLFAKMAEHADAVVTVSEFSASRIAHFFPALEPKLRVIHNASHAVFGSEPSPAVLEKVKSLSAGAPFVLVPGGLSLRKNAELIVKAWPKLTQAQPRLKLVVAGSCDGDYARRLGAHGAGNLVLPGYVSDELLNALYHKADVVWFPSRYEGFGMPVLEAMTAGAPVVTSDAASLPEVVGSAALLCGVDDSSAHVDAIDSLLSSDSAMADLRRRSLEQSLKFSWAASADKLDALFQSL